MVLVGYIVFVVLCVISNTVLLPLLAIVFTPLSAIGSPWARGLAAGILDSTKIFALMLIVVAIFPCNPWILWGIDTLWTLRVFIYFANRFAAIVQVLAIAVYIVLGAYTPLGYVAVPVSAAVVVTVIGFVKQHQLIDLYRRSPHQVLLWAAKFWLTSHPATDRTQLRESWPIIAKELARPGVVKEYRSFVTTAGSVTPPSLVQSFSPLLFGSSTTVELLDELVKCKSSLADEIGTGVPSQDVGVNNAEG